MMKMTDLQREVLAALKRVLRHVPGEERSVTASVVQGGLSPAFDEHSPSRVQSVLTALERKGLVSGTVEGDGVRRWSVSDVGKNHVQRV